MSSITLSFLLRVSSSLVLVLGLAKACAAQAGETERSSIVLNDVAARAGVVFRFHHGSRGRHDLPEIMGGGVALFDADGDGRLDLYLCDGGPIGDGKDQSDPPCRLFRNRGGMRFEDVTDAAGCPGPSYAMGAVAGDYDGDGRVDLFVTGWRGQRLYRNRGGGQFEDVTRQAGLESSRWSTSAAFADLDGDGDLDLYVATYLEYDPALAPYCAAPDGRRDYCGPEDFPAQPDMLYRNNGDGTFTDLAAKAGIDQPPGRGLGVLVAELTGDNRPDVFVANDGSPCRLYANQGNLAFREIALESGVATDGNGEALAGMGVAFGDLMGSGRPMLMVANFLGRGTVAFEQSPGPAGPYRDVSSAIGLKGLTKGMLGFGLAMVDLDGGGSLELIQTNGHVLDRERLGTPFRMRPVIVGVVAGRLVARVSWPSERVLGRGLAVGDLDGDGRPDLVAAALDAPVAILHNESPGKNRLMLELVDQRGLPAYGARVRLTAGGRTRSFELVSGGSYLSSSPPWLSIGLGVAESVDRIEVDWPWGKMEAWTRPKISPDKRLRLTAAGQ